MTCANYLGYACSCGGECLEMAKVQIKKNHHNRYPGRSGCPCPARRRVHQQVYLHPCPMLLMLRNHVWDQRRTDGMICMVVENPPGGYPQNPPDGRYVWGLFCV
jgi:hypothetical protein